MSADDDLYEKHPFLKRMGEVEKAWTAPLLQYALSYSIAFRNFRLSAPGMTALEGDEDHRTRFHSHLLAATLALVPTSLPVAAIAQTRLPLLDTRPALYPLCAGALARTWSLQQPFIANPYLYFVLGDAAQDTHWQHAPDLLNSLPRAADLETDIFSPNPFILRTELLNGHLRMLIASRALYGHVRDTIPEASAHKVTDALLKAPLAALPANQGDVWNTAEMMELCFHLCMLVDPPIRHEGSRMRQRVDALHRRRLGDAFFDGRSGGDRIIPSRALESLMHIAEKSRPRHASEVRL